MVSRPAGLAGYVTVWMHLISVLPANAVLCCTLLCSLHAFRCSAVCYSYSVSPHAVCFRRSLFLLTLGAATGILRRQISALLLHRALLLEYCPSPLRQFQTRVPLFTCIPDSSRQHNLHRDQSTCTSISMQLKHVVFQILDLKYWPSEYMILSVEIRFGSQLRALRAHLELGKWASSGGLYSDPSNS
jgi:hypothetical protein